MPKHILIAAGLAAVLLAPPATSGFAQTAPASPTSSSPRQQSADQWRASRLIGATVYDTDNTSVGEVDDLVIGRNGDVRAVVVGVGEKNVALPFASLTIRRMQGSNAIDKIVVGYSKQQLNESPQFSFDGAAQSQTIGSGGASNAVDAPPR